MLGLDPQLLPAAQAAARLFPLKVPRGYVARMSKGDLNDPLLKQVLPLGAELLAVEGYQTDPLQESNANPVPGLLHKYEGRVLVMLTSACAIHCRYCFRRSFPYDDNQPGKRGWEKMMAYIAADESISEVILSGGDPLAVNDPLLQTFTDELSAIAHVKRLRIHTRLPIVLPERITAELIQWLTTMRFQPVIVVHANHPQEIDVSVTQALQALRQAGITLLNQTVLLKGINDSADIQIALIDKLFSAGVLPYYLHVPDKVAGTAHFDLPLSEAQQLHATLNSRLPGYLVPRLVREEPGQSSKSHLTINQ